MRLPIQPFLALSTIYTFTVPVLHLLLQTYLPVGRRQELQLDDNHVMTQKLVSKVCPSRSVLVIMQSTGESLNCSTVVLAMVRTSPQPAI